MPANTDKSNHNLTGVHLGLLVLLVLVAYSKVFHAGFMNWDDQEYVFHTADIAGGIGWLQIKNWFSSYYIGNYQPLPIFTYSIDHLLGKTNAFAYHFDSLLWHIINCGLLYLIVGRLQANKWVALVVALVFAVHPVQTESVSWIAERKTLVCAFFYLLAVLQYTRYANAPSIKGMVTITALGIAAMLSKGVAVSLPLALLAVDVWSNRDLKARQVWVEKLPLLLCGALFGYIAIQAQAAGHFLGLHSGLGIADTVVFAGYTYVQYIVHFFVPYQLSVIYPYPKEIGFIHWLYLVIAVLIMVLGVVAYRRKWYVLCGGILFYTVNIALVLQFIQFGEVLMADRYLYLPCIGIVFPAVYYLFRWAEGISKPVIARVVSVVAGLVLILMTFVRNDIWLSDLNFYTSIVSTFPQSAVGHYSLGALYMKMGKYAEAEQHADLAVVLDPGNYNAWYNKGALYLKEGKAMESLDALNRCLALNDYPKARVSRAMLYQGTGKPGLALADIENAIAAQPHNARAWYIKADCQEQLGDINGAVESYTAAIAYDDNDPLFYIRRGLARARVNNLQAGLDDLSIAVNMAPKSGEALFYRGVLRHKANQNPCDDFEAARKLGYPQAAAAIDKFCHGL